MAFEDDVLDKVRRLKQSARTHRSFGDHAAALADIERAISRLEEAGGDWLAPDSQAPAPPDRLERPHELADLYSDCLGVQGGGLRRLGRIDEALESYVAGSRFEIDPRFKVEKSYNMVNALKMALLGEATPATSDDPAPEIKADIPDIDQAIARIEKQLSDSRRMDRWAWADLGDCYLMKGGEDAATRALDAYRRFVKLSDEESLESAHDVMTKLAEELSSPPEDARAAAVRRVADLLADALDAL